MICEAIVTLERGMNLEGSEWIRRLYCLRFDRFVRKGEIKRNDNSRILDDSRVEVEFRRAMTCEVRDKTF